MLAEDEAYMKTILKEFDVTKYKLSETPTRFKLIINPDSFSMDTLNAVQKDGTVGIEVDVSKCVYLECLKGGHSRKRRRTSAEVFRGTLPKEYDVGKYNKVMRHLLGVEDMCAFKAKVVDGSLQLREVECLTYALLKRISDLGVSISFDMRDAKITMTL